MLSSTILKQISSINYNITQYLHINPLEPYQIRAFEDGHQSLNVSKSMSNTHCWSCF